MSNIVYMQFVVYYSVLKIELQKKYKNLSLVSLLIFF